MKIDFKTCSEKELWQYVAVHLKKHGIDTVLVGGSVVSVYTDGAYKSGDLDFIKLDLFTTGIEKAMKEMKRAQDSWINQSTNNIAGSTYSVFRKKHIDNDWPSQLDQLIIDEIYTDLKGTILAEYINE